MSEQPVVKKISKEPVEKEGILLYNDEWKKKYIHPDLLSKEYDLFVDEIQTSGIGRDIYCFPAFNPEFCDEVVYKANTKHDWGRIGHQEYRTYDTWLESLGLDKVYKVFLQEYVLPLAEHVYGEVGNDFKNIDKTENFIAKYTSNHEHSALQVHIDDSEFSVQVSLNTIEEYIGGGTWYPKQKALVKVPKGYMVMHPGSIGFSHGARRVMSGTRYQLVSFIKGHSSGSDTLRPAF